MNFSVLFNFFLFSRSLCVFCLAPPVTRLRRIKKGETVNSLLCKVKEKLVLAILPRSTLTLPSISFINFLACQTTRYGERKEKGEDEYRIRTESHTSLIKMRNV